MNTEKKIKQRHFVIGSISTDEIQKLVDYQDLLTNHQIPHIPYQELHLTLLYFEPENTPMESILDHFKQKIDSLKRLELTVNKVNIESRKMWASIEKDKSLQAIHSEITMNLPEHFGGENVSFNDWTPHIMLARRLPEKINTDKADFFNKFLKMNSFELSIALDKFFLTKQNPDSFEILYSK